MEALEIITLWCIVVSLLFVLTIDGYARYIRKNPLVAWQRWTIPLPAFLMAASNLAGVLSLKSYVATHPGAFAVRSGKSDGGHVGILFVAGLASMFFLPLFLSHNFNEMRRLTPVIWVLLILWMFIVWFPMALSTGVPLQD